LELDLHEAFEVERRSMIVDREMVRIVEFNRPYSIPARVSWRTHLQRIAAMLAVSAGVLALGLIYWAGTPRNSSIPRTAATGRSARKPSPEPADGIAFVLSESPSGDAAAYSCYAEIRRAIRAGRLPSRETVRVRNLVNHFSYGEPATSAEAD